MGKWRRGDSYARLVAQPVADLAVQHERVDSQPAVFTLAGEGASRRVAGGTQIPNLVYVQLAPALMLPATLYYCARLALTPALAGSPLAGSLSLMPDSG